MRRNCFLVVFTMTLILWGAASADLLAQTKPATRTEEAPLRVALAGLVHGHVNGFFDRFQHRADLQVVGIAEPDRQVAAQFAKRHGLAPGLFYSDLEEMLKATHPPAVIPITNHQH